ncbi:MAG: hypothetical protein AAF242_11625 [Bacteroidota bacterium]
MNKQIYLFMLLIIFSCTNPESSETSEDQAATQTQEAKNFKVLDSYDFDLSKLSHEGEITTIKFWQDAQGDNIVLFTKQEDLTKGEADLFAYHYLIEQENPRLLHDIKDSVTDCADADLLLDFDTEAFSITDLDQDNIGELTFAYKMTCTTDVSPQTLILHLFEGDSDYTLVGDTEVPINAEETIGGAIRETNFADAPAMFLPHAKDVWEKVKKF